MMNTMLSQLQQPAFSYFSTFKSHLFAFTVLIFINLTTLGAQGLKLASTTLPINLAMMADQLKQAPEEGTLEAMTSPFTISLPLPDGTSAVYFVEASDVMEKSFHLANPDIKTYKVFNEATLSFGRMVVSPYGLHALIFTEAGSYYIDPVDKHAPVLHRVFYPKFEIEPGVCDLDSNEEEFRDDLKRHFALQNALEKTTTPNGATKRTYRLAITSTGEFYQDADFGNNNLATALAAITQVVSDNSAKYELELAIVFTGVVVNAAVYSNPATDPFVPDQSNGVSRTSQAAAVIGQHYASGTYDLGHCLHATTSGGSGVAGLGIVCNSNALSTPTGYTTGGTQKGRGWSGGSNHPTLVNAIMWHEIGHQFGMNHTFNGTGSSCTSNIASNSSFEIGSGTTIMSYNGSCQANNNIPSGGTADEYFHAKSLEQALTYIGASGGCATTSATGNSPPTVNANPCGGSTIIPVGTPFRLTGSGSDPNGNPIFYTWEQIDEDGTGTPTQGFIGTTAAASSLAPLFRSFPPNSSPTRYFPNLALIAANNYASSFEPLPTVARTLNFRLVARDNNPAGGGVNGANLALTISASGPFVVTAPNGGETLTAGSSTTITWSVNGTHTFCNNVNLKLSIDGGLSYPYTLLTNTPNDGSQSVTLPANVTNTTQARVMVECADNDCIVFFDISNANFSISSNCNAASSKICPTTPVSLPVGDPGLNFNFNLYRTSAVTAHSFTTGAGDPTMNRVRWNTGRTACMTPGGTPPNYQVFSFVVEQAGNYGFSFGSSNFRAVHLFATTFNPAGGCTNFVASSVENGAGYYNALISVPALTPCTVYHLVGTNEAFGGNTTITFSGPGAIYPVFTSPANYAYTFIAVNTANGQVASVSATSNFTGLPAGSYHVYGASYYNGAGPNPPVVNPANWVGQTLSQILSGGNCVLFSANFRPVTITGPTCTPPTVNAPTVTQPTCATPTGTIVVNATGSGTLEYSVNNGSTWQASNSFSSLAPGNYNIRVRLQANPTCVTAYTSNPVTINAAPTDPCICNVYCTASQTMGSCAGGNEFISNLTFNTINNSSTCAQSLPSGFTNYTNLSTTVNIGATFSLLATNGAPFTGDQCRAWFDWNADGDFTDPGEEFILTGSGINSAQNWTVNVTVPAGASLGSTRMRVRIARNASPVPCGNSDFGETEDYCITINAANCPTNQTVNNNPVASGTYQASQVITSTGTVANWGNVTFRAYQGVELLPNFEVQAGGVFEIIMTGCNN